MLRTPRPAGACGPLTTGGRLQKDGMTTLRDIHKYMNAHSYVRLQDGRTGKIVRVDTVFPDNDTTVTVWTETAGRPGVAKVRLGEVVGPVQTVSA
jgi:hypothetical protein